jgi:phosphoribosylformylglycinamidine synthase
LYKHEFLGDLVSAPPPVDLELERRHGEFIQFIIKKGWVTACHDVSDGGQLVAIAEMAMAGGIGASIDIAPDLARAFGEDQGRYIITATHEMAERIIKNAPEKGISAMVIGETGGEDLMIGDRHAAVAELKKINEHTLPSFMNA